MTRGFALQSQEYKKMLKTMVIADIDKITARPVTNIPDYVHESYFNKQTIEHQRLAEPIIHCDRCNILVNSL